MKLMGFGLRGHCHGKAGSSTTAGTVRAIFIGLPRTSSNP